MKLERTGSIWNRSNRNGINNNWERLEGVLKNIDALVANGQLTPQQYAQLLTHLNGFIQKGELSVDDINKNLGKIDQSFLSDELLSQITGGTPISSVVADGSVTSEKLANFAVTPDKTTFFNTTGNLFDGNYLNGLLVRDNWGSELMPVYNYDNYQGKVAVIPIEPGKAYTVSIDVEQSTSFRVGVHRTADPFQTHPHTNYLDRVILSGTLDDRQSSVSFAAQDDENFAFIYVSSDGTETPMIMSETTLKSQFMGPPNLHTVTPEMTTFFQQTDGNLFNGAYEDGLLFGVDREEGRTFFLRSNYGGLLGKTAVIPVEPNTTYAAKQHDVDPESSFRIALMDNYPTFYNTNTFNGEVDDFVVDIPIGEPVKEHTFTTTSTSQYALVYVSGTGLEPRLMFEKGSTFSTYTSGNFIPLQYMDTEGLRNLMLYESADNLYDGELYPGILFRDDNGTTLRPTNNYSGLQGRTAVIPIQPGTAYELDVDISFTFSLRIGIDSNADVWQDHPATYELDRVLHDGFDTSASHFEFTAASNENYLFVYYAHTGADMPIRLREAGAGGNAAIAKDAKYNITGNFDTLYESPELEDYWEDANSISPIEYHSRFQELINEHSDIASYKKIGEDDFNNAIYQYEINPLDYHYSTYWNFNPGNEGPIMPKAKIMVLAGIHGREKNPSFAMYYVMKHILENKENLDTLDSILTQVHLVFVPLACPNGFIDYSYENRNGVNVSRDFPPYGPLSQGESKAIFAAVNENADMDYFIDFHNMQPRHNLIGFSLTENDFFLNSTLNVYRSVGRMWQKKDSRFPQSIMHRWAYTGGVNPGTIEAYTERELGVPTTLIETPIESQFISGDGRHGPKITQLSVDVLMNMLFTVIRNSQ